MATLAVPGGIEPPLGESKSPVLAVIREDYMVPGLRIRTVAPAYYGQVFYP